MSDTNKALAREFYDGVNAGDLSVIDRLVSDDLVEHEELPPGLERNKAGVRAMFEAFRTAFPDLRMQPEGLLADGDLVSVHGLITGTHRGDFMGMPPTGRTIAVGFADFLRIEHGQAVEHWGVTDTGALMQQLTG
jgi:steroid delta-isomerase-like uncharacterized protein